MAALIFRSWSAGGTHITDIDANHIDICREAVRQYGDTNLVVSDKRMSYQITGGGSLHDLTGIGIRNLSTFWKIYRDLESQGWKPDHTADAYDRAMKGIG